MGVKLSAASQHLRLLAEAGMVVSGKGRLCSLPPGVLAEGGGRRAAGGGRELLLGICTLRFGGEDDRET